MYDSSKSIWFNPNIEYLFDEDIIEYDIRDAGFSIIKQYGLLPRDDIIRLESTPKEKRHVAIGVMQRNDKILSKALSDNFAQVRDMFIKKNKIESSSIISVKKDAIFTTTICKYRKFDNIEFVEKNRYSSYIRFTTNKNIEIYYNSGLTDVKGIGELSVNKHRLYMLDFINKMIKMLENGDTRIKKEIIKFQTDYMSGNLDDEYYLKFDNRSIDIDPMFNYREILIVFANIILKEL